MKNVHQLFLAAMAMATSYMPKKWGGWRPRNGWRNYDKKWQKPHAREMARLARREILDTRSAFLNPAWKGQPWVAKRFPQLKEQMS